MWPSLLTRELADALLDSVGLRFSMPHLPTSEDIPVSEEVSSVFGAAAALPRAGEAVEPDHLWLGLLREGSLSAHLSNSNSSDEKFEKLLRDRLSAFPPISVQDIEKAATAALTQEDIEDERKNWDL